MNEAIRIAIEKGGYKYHKWGEVSKDVANSNRWLAFNPDRKTFHPVTENDFILDPLFWQALGKALGWDDLVCDKCEHSWQGAFRNRKGKNTEIECTYCFQVADPIMCWLKVALDYQVEVLTGGDVEAFWKGLLK